MSYIDFFLAKKCQISFASMITQPTGVGPMSVRAADFNNDSFLDLAVANHDGGTTTILLGNGNGSFGKRIDLSNGANAGTNEIAIGDVNKDNRLDIVVVNRNASNVGVFLGVGDGNFSSQTTIPTGNNSSPAGLALHDLNNDTILDLVVTDHVNSMLFVFLGAGNGSFTKTMTLRTDDNAGPYFIIIDDFNKDNLFDIAVGNGDGGYIGLFLGYGTRHFSRQIAYDIGSGPYALVATDVNRDGVLDILTANYDGNNTSVLLGNGDGTFRLKNTFSTGCGSLPYAIAIGDFNGDDIQDMIVPNSGTDNVGILLGNGNGKFKNLKTYSTADGSDPLDVAVGDLNGDHRLDFISANYHHNSIGIFLSTCV